MSVISPEFNATYEISDGGALEWAGDDAIFDYESMVMPDFTTAAQPDLLANEVVMSSDTAVDQGETSETAELQPSRAGKGFRVARNTIAVAGMSVALMANHNGCSGAFEHVREEGTDFSNHPFKGDPDKARGGTQGRQPSYCDQLYDQAYPGGLPDYDKARQYNQEC